MNNFNFSSFIQVLSIDYKVDNFAKQFFIYITSCHMPNISFHVRQEMETRPPISILNKEMSTNNK